jgi:hypothetical protein
MAGSAERIKNKKPVLKLSLALGFVNERRKVRLGLEDRQSASAARHQIMMHGPTSGYLELSCLSFDSMAWILDPKW